MSSQLRLPGITILAHSRKNRNGSAAFQSLRDWRLTHLRVIGQANVGFMHERGWLEAWLVAPVPHVSARQAAEFVVDQGVSRSNAL
jgi:hypothetical protein